MSMQSVHLRENAFSEGQETFLPVDTKDKEKKLRDKGRKDGMENFPKSQDKTLGAAEQEITTDIEQTVEQTRQAITRHFAGFNQRLQGIVDTIKPQALISDIKSNYDTGSLNNALDNFERESIIPKDDCKRADQAFINFCEEHKRTGPPNNTTTKHLVSWLIPIAAAESILNTSLLWEGLGYGKAFGQLALIASVNVLFMAWIFGFLLCPWVNHVKQFYKRLFGTLCLACFLCIAAFNLGVGHYREMLVIEGQEWEQVKQQRWRSLDQQQPQDPSNSENSISPIAAAQEAWKNIVNDPFGISNILSWLLVLIGILSFGVASYKWYSRSGSYPGHRKCYEVRKAKFKEYEDICSSAEKKIEGEIKKIKEGIKGERTKLMNNRKNHRDISGRAETIQKSYVDWVKVLTQKQNCLLTAYRESNRRVREESEPDYFQKDIEIAPHLVAPPSFSFPELDEEKIEEVLNEIDLMDKKTDEDAKKVLDRFRKIKAIQVDSMYSLQS